MSLSSWETSSEVKLWRRSARRCPEPRERDHILQRTTKNTRRVSAPRSKQRQAERATDPYQGDCVCPLRRERIGGTAIRAVKRSDAILACNHSASLESVFVYLQIARPLSRQQPYRELPTLSSTSNSTEPITEHEDRGTSGPRLPRISRVRVHEYRVTFPFNGLLRTSTVM